MQIVSSIATMQRLARKWQRAGTRIGFVPTMGYLHAGHLSLAHAARNHVGKPGKVGVSIYVNPTQFAPTEDLSKYPRNLKRDLRLCREAGVDVVFVPSDAEMYPQVGSSRCDDRTAQRAVPTSSSGLDEIEFQFAPNAGEPAKPLRAIASSGEMARVMLALKTVLAAEDEIPVLIFDEVDANIGGETANAVGEKMKQIAARRQVLCITHLPQVAAPADAHYVVTKQIKDGRTISGITLLDKKSRVTELARMLGGQSEAARKHAEALLK